MSIVSPDVFADRITQYAEQNPDASTPEILGRFLLEPTDEQRAFVEDVLVGDVETAARAADSDDGSTGAEA